MTDLLVEIDGAVARLDGCSWVFRGPCGCAFGVTIAVTSRRVLATVDQAWEYLQENRIQRERDRAAGCTASLATTAEAVSKVRLGCDHEPKYGLPVTPVPAGYVWAASDGWRARPRYKHLVADALPRDHRTPHQLLPSGHEPVPALCERSSSRDWSVAPWVVDDLPECSACQRAAAPAVAS
jgi:hypothetical protein